MLLAPVAAPVSAAAVSPERSAAAKALLEVPAGVIMTAAMVGMGKAMSGQPASRSELVAPLLEKLTPDAVSAMILTAIDGALAVAPELAPKTEALRQSAAGVAALLTAAAADTVQGEAGATVEKFTTEFAAVAGPLFVAVQLLDPEAMKEQQLPGA